MDRPASGIDYQAHIKRMEELRRRTDPASVAQGKRRDALMTLICDGFNEGELQVVGARGGLLDVVALLRQLSDFIASDDVRAAFRVASAHGYETDNVEFDGPRVLELFEHLGFARHLHDEDEAERVVPEPESLEYQLSIWLDDTGFPEQLRQGLNADETKSLLDTLAAARLLFDQNQRDLDLLERERFELDAEVKERREDCKRLVEADQLRREKHYALFKRYLNESKKLKECENESARERHRGDIDGLYGERATRAEAALRDVSRLVRKHGALTPESAGQETYAEIEKICKAVFEKRLADPQK